MLWNRKSRVWNPWMELDMLQEAMRSANRQGYPAVNISVEDDKAMLSAEVPGYNADDFNISVENNEITIKGKTPEHSEDGYKFIKRERRNGSFSRSFSLPFRINADEVKAAYKNGILAVSIPRAEEDKPKQISVTVG